MEHFQIYMPVAEYDFCKVCKGSGKMPNKEKTWMSLIYGGNSKVCSKCKGDGLLPINKKVKENLHPILKKRKKIEPISVEDRLFKIISDQSGMPLDKIDRKDHFIEDLKLDSLDIIGLITKAEVEFQIDIFINEAEEIFTVEQAIKFIDAKVNSLL